MVVRLLGSRVRNSLVTYGKVASVRVLRYTLLTWSNIGSLRITTPVPPTLKGMREYYSRNWLPLNLTLLSPLADGLVVASLATLIWKPSTAYLGLWLMACAWCLFIIQLLVFILLSFRDS